MNITKFTPYPNTLQSFGVAGLTILAMLIFTPLNLYFNSILGKGPSMLIYYCLSMLCPIFIFHSLKKKNEGGISYDFRLKDPILIITLIIATLAILNVITAPSTSLIPTPDFVKELFRELYYETKNAYGFATIAIAAPILEEILFRGIILDGLLKKYNPLKAILISSFLFGIVHLNPWQFIGAFQIGLFIGYVYYHTRNVGYCILIHLSNNLTAALIMIFVDEEIALSDDLYTSYGGVESFYIIFVVSLLLMIPTGIYLFNRFKKNSEKASFSSSEQENEITEES